MIVDNRNSILAPLFPPGIVTTELYPISAEARYVLHTEESALTSSMSPKRLKEFSAGRHCARRALLGLGASSIAILQNNDRSPIWPPGVVGSIAHSDGLCGAAVAWRSDVRGIGLDIERIGRVGQDIWKKICTSDEQRCIASLPDDQQDIHAHLVFSAKETTYKCQYPLSEQWLGFHDVCISIDMASRQFQVELLTDVADMFRTGELLVGRFSIWDGYVLTGMVWA